MFIGIKDRLFGDAQQIADRANKKIVQLRGLTTKLLFPGFKQIESDLKDLGVDLSSSNNFDFDYSRFGDSFTIDASSAYLLFNCWLEDATIDSDGVYIEGVFVFFDNSVSYGMPINLPELSDFIKLDDFSYISLNSSNIRNFEKYMDDLMSYITRNSQLIIDTIEDVSIEVLRKAGKL